MNIAFKHATKERLWTRQSILRKLEKDFDLQFSILPAAGRNLTEAFFLLKAQDEPSKFASSSIPYLPSSHYQNQALNEKKWQ